jgi:hypothetical protein
LSGDVEDTIATSGDQNELDMSADETGLGTFLNFCELPYPQCLNSAYEATLVNTKDCIFGTTISFVGFTSLIKQHWNSNHKLHVFTFIFVPISVILSISIIMSGAGLRVKDSNFMVILFVMYTLFPAMYGDWVLGIMADNLLGTPSGDSAILYWPYFILKRLTMLSS